MYQLRETAVKAPGAVLPSHSSYRLTANCLGIWGISEPCVFTDIQRDRLLSLNLWTNGGSHIPNHAKLNSDVQTANKRCIGKTSQTVTPRLSQSCMIVTLDWLVSQRHLSHLGGYGTILGTPPSEMGQDCCLSASSTVFSPKRLWFSRRSVCLSPEMKHRVLVSSPTQSPGFPSLGLYLKLHHCQRHKAVSKYFFLH